MKKITLGKKAHKHKGLFALVDDEDFEELNRHNWSARWDSGIEGYYAARTITLKGGAQTTIRMHRQVLGAKKGEQVDHKNHDTLDDRKQNLRIVTSAQNQANQRPTKGSSSEYKGVSWCKRDKKWQAYIRVARKRKHQGLYVDEEAAARAYDIAAKEHFGEYAYLNFSDKN